MITQSRHLNRDLVLKMRKSILLGLLIYLSNGGLLYYPTARSYKEPGTSIFFCTVIFKVFSDEKGKNQIGTIHPTLIKGVHFTTLVGFRKIADNFLAVDPNTPIQRAIFKYD